MLDCVGLVWIGVCPGWVYSLIFSALEDFGQVRRVIRDECGADIADSWTWNVEQKDPSDE